MRGRGGPRSTEIHSPCWPQAAGGSKAPPPRLSKRYSSRRAPAGGDPRPTSRAGPSEPPGSATPGAARAQSLGRPGSRNGLRGPFPLGVTPEAQPAWQQDGFSSDWLGTETASRDHPKALLACDSGAKGHPSRPSGTAHSPFLLGPLTLPKPVPSGLTLKLRAYCVPGTVFQAVYILFKIPSIL